MCEYGGADYLVIVIEGRHCPYPSLYSMSVQRPAIRSLVRLIRFSSGLSWGEKAWGFRINLLAASRKSYSQSVNQLHRRIGENKGRRMKHMVCGLFIINFYVWHLYGFSFLQVFINRSYCMVKGNTAFETTWSLCYSYIARSLQCLHLLNFSC